MANLDPTIIVLIVAGLAGVFVLALMIQLNAAQESKRIKGRLERTRSKRSGCHRWGHGERPPHPGRWAFRGDRRIGAALHAAAGKAAANGSTGRVTTCRSARRSFFAMIAGIVVTTGVWIGLSPPGMVLVLVFILSSTLLPHFVIAVLIKRRDQQVPGRISRSARPYHPGSQVGPARPGIDPQCRRGVRWPRRARIPRGDGQDQVGSAT